MHAHCIPRRMTTPRAVRAMLRADEAEAAARRAVGVPLKGYVVSVPAWRWHLRSLQGQLVRLRRGRERAAKRAQR